MDEKELSRIYWNKELKRRYLAGDRDFRGFAQKNLYLSYYCLIDIDLSCGNLAESEFTRTSLINANFNQANLEKVGLNSTLLIKANLSNANLRDATLVSANLTGADLTGADLTGADLTDAVLIETNLTDANLTDIKTTDQTIFHQVTMPDGRIQNDLNRAVSAEELLGRYAEGERHFQNKILHRVDLSGADLRDLGLSHSHSSYVNFSDACLENNRGLGREVIFCDLRSARLSRPEDWSAGCFIYCDLRGANLAGLDMSNASFIGSNLLGAKNCLSGGIQGDLFFYETTWCTGEFIQGPTSATYHWRRKNVREGYY